MYVGVELELSSVISVRCGVLSTSLVLHRVFHSGFHVLHDCIRIQFCLYWNLAVFPKFLAISFPARE